MAGNEVRAVYLGQSKPIVRERLGLKDDDEDFDKFENICKLVYKHKLDFNPKFSWKDMDTTIKTGAGSMVKEDCRKQQLALVKKVENKDFDDLIEWRLHLLHKAVRQKEMKKGETIAAEPMSIDPRPHYYSQDRQGSWTQ